MVDKVVADASAVKVLADLAKDASGFSIHSLSAPAGALGIPNSITVGFDHRRTGSDAVIDLKPFFDTYRTHPERRQGIETVDTLQSFIALVNRLRVEQSVIFADADYPDPFLTAVINYHAVDGNGIAGYRDHRVQYDFPVTDEFKAWLHANATGMRQGDFAGFIEERIAEIASPTREEEAEFGGLFQTKVATPAEMMMLSRGLEVNVNGKAGAAIRLSSGETQVSFSEEHTTNIVVPGMFIVAVPPFRNGPPVRLAARLRYRVANGAVTWFYQLYKHVDVLRARVLEDMAIASAETGLPAYEGSSE